MNIKTVVLAVAVGLASWNALAQWQWIDPSGRKVFSDRAPGPEVPEKNILRRPGQLATPAPAAGTEEATAAAAAPKPTPPRPSGKDEALEAKKKEAEAAEAAKKKAEEERLKKAKEENCARAKAAKATLESGQRIARMNAQGEREILDDAARAAELKRTEEIIRSECN